MEKERKSFKQYGSLERTKFDRQADKKAEEDIVSMADSTITIDHIEGELFRIERIRDVLVRRESELRYMCRGKRGETQRKDNDAGYGEVQLLGRCAPMHTDGRHSALQGNHTAEKRTSEAGVCFSPSLSLNYLTFDTDKSNEDRQREEELLQQIHKLVETRDFLVDDVEFERLREREEDKEMADFLQSKFPKTLKKKDVTEDRRMTSKAQQTSSTPFVTKTGLTLLKECCGFTCSVM
ncbi:bMERB domain-containing protein 1-like isoform 1-T1 [Salvelinus alpinus]